MVARAVESTPHDLRHLSSEELRLRADALLQQIEERRFAGIQREKNVKKLLALRHERARVLTILREKQRQGQPVEPAARQLSRA